MWSHLFFGISLQIFKTMSVKSAWCVRKMLLTHRHIFLKNKLLLDPPLMRALHAGVFFLCSLWLRGRLDQMVPEYCSWEVQSTSWHLQTNLQDASILSGSAELPRSHPQFAVSLYVRVCVRSCSKGSSSTVTDSTWATSPTKRSVWRQDTAGPGGSTTLTTWDRFVSDAHTFPSRKHTLWFFLLEHVT